MSDAQTTTGFPPSAEELRENGADGLQGRVRGGGGGSACGSALRSEIGVLLVMLMDTMLVGRDSSVHRHSPRAHQLAFSSPRAPLATYHTNQPSPRGVAGLESCPSTPTSSPLRPAPCHAAETATTRTAVSFDTSLVVQLVFELAPSHLSLSPRTTGPTQHNCKACRSRSPHLATLRQPLAASERAHCREGQERAAGRLKLEPTQMSGEGRRRTRRRSS